MCAQPRLVANESTDFEALGPFFPVLIVAILLTLPLPIFSRVLLYHVFPTFLSVDLQEISAILADLDTQLPFSISLTLGQPIFLAPPFISGAKPICAYLPLLVASYVVVPV